MIFKCIRNTRILVDINKFFGQYGLILKGGSRTAATSKVELFVIIVNDWKTLTIMTKSSTLDVAAVLDPPVIFIDYCWFMPMKNPGMNTVVI